MNIIMLGKPGAGKGTQSVKLTKEEDFKILNTGDLIRQEIHEGTDLGKEIKSFVSSGELVPDEVVTSLLMQHMNGKNTIFDGFPRTRPQAEFLDSKITISKVIFLHVEDDIILDRIEKRVDVKIDKKTVSFPDENSAQKFIEKKGGQIIQRSDSNRETIKKRLEQYRANTKPLVDYYKEQGKFYSVDSNQSIAEVHKDILKIINN